MPAMIQYIRLTNNTLHWFLPLLPPEEKLALETFKTLYAIGAVKDGRACGIMVFNVSTYLADIRYLAVARSCQRQGIAKGMILYLCRHAMDSATPVACTFSCADKQSPIYLLFAGMDIFSVSELEGFCCRIPMAGLAQKPALARLRSCKRIPRQFFQLPKAQRNQFFQKLLQQDIYYLREIPEEDYIKPLCLYTADPEGTITAAVFISRTGQNDGDLQLACAWSAFGPPNDLMGLLSYACTQLPEKGDLWIAAVNPASASIVNKVLPDRVITDRFYRAAWDMEL